MHHGIEIWFPKRLTMGYRMMQTGMEVCTMNIGWDLIGSQNVSDNWPLTLCESQYNRIAFSWSKPSVQCRSELNWPPLSIRHNYLSLITIYDMLHNRSCFNFLNILLFLPCVLDLILSLLYIVNSLTLTPIGTPFY